MFPLFALQAKMAQCATDIMISGASAAVAVASASMDTAAKSASDGGGKSKSRKTASSALPVKITSGSGFPMFDPFMFTAAQSKPKTFPAYFPFEWPMAASSWPTFASPAWSAHMWVQSYANPFAFFANLYPRKRSAMEQMFDPLGLWLDDTFTLPNPFAQPSLPTNSSTALHHAASETVKNVQAAAIALMTPAFLKNTGFFPTPWLGV